MSLYGALGADIRLDSLSWRFRSGARIAFGHLEHEKTVLAWQGAQVPFIGFDELTHFTASQFWYLLSRNRSTCGVRPYVRCTTNPDADSWVAIFIEWWIDQLTGLPIAERAGVMRWFIRLDDEFVWGDSEAELREAHPGCEPKTVTFIPAGLDDNQILVAKDPGYRANLMALNAVDRARLLGGNWKVRPSAGMYFQRAWCPMVDTIPAGTVFCRGWDLAATKKTALNDPDWTCGTKLGRMPDGRFIVANHLRMREGPFEVRAAVLNIASHDGASCRIALPQDAAQAGKDQAQQYIAALAGYNVRAKPVTGDKVTRFGAFSAQAEAGNVCVLRADWNEIWFSELEGFPDGAHDDDADSTSEAFNALTGKSAAGWLEYAAKQVSTRSAPTSANPIVISPTLPGTAPIDADGWIKVEESAPPGGLFIELSLDGATASQKMQYHPGAWLSPEVWWRPVT